MACRGLGFVTIISSSTFQALLDRLDDVKIAPPLNHSGCLEPIFPMRMCRVWHLSAILGSVFEMGKNYDRMFHLNARMLKEFLLSIVPSRSEIRPPTCKKSQKW